MSNLDRRAPTVAAGLCALALVAIAACGGPSTEPVTPADPPSTAGLEDLVDAATLDEIEAASLSVKGSLRSASAWTRLGELYEVAAMPSEAETAYLSASSLTPDEPKHLYRAAIAAEAQGDTGRAISTLERALDMDPDYGPAWRRKGTWLLDLGRSAEAREAFEQADARLAGVPDAKIGLARTALLEDKIEEGLRHARAAHRLAEDAPYVRLILGEALRRAGLDDEAAPHLRAGQGATPTYSDPWSESIQRRKNRDMDLMAKAKEHQSRQEHTLALAAYDDVLSRRPDDTSALLGRGTSLLGLGRVDESLRHFDKATQRFPGDYELLVGQASALRRAGAREDALARVDAIVARWDDRPTAYLLRGQILNDMGRVGEARQSYRKARQIAPMDLRPEMFEARMLLQRDRADEAAAILTAAIERTDIVPSLTFFENTLQAQLIAGSPTSAIDRTYLRAVELHGDAAKQRLTKSGNR